MTTMRDILAKHVPNAPLSAPKRSKYGNRKTVLDGMVFDSAQESRDWADLSLRQKAGEIRNLRRQVTFECVWNDVPVCKYIADFAYEELTGEHWRKVVADSKGFSTALFRLKAKILKATHNIEIRLMKGRRS